MKIFLKIQTTGGGRPISSVLVRVLPVAVQTGSGLSSRHSNQRCYAKGGGEGGREKEREKHEGGVGGGGRGTEGGGRERKKKGKGGGREKGGGEVKNTKRGGRKGGEDKQKKKGGGEGKTRKNEKPQKKKKKKKQKTCTKGNQIVLPSFVDPPKSFPLKGGVAGGLVMVWWRFCGVGGFVVGLRRLLATAPPPTPPTALV